MVGTLRSAKKRKIIKFRGQMLLKGMHDNVPIQLSVDNDDDGGDSGAIVHAPVEAMEPDTQPVNDANNNDVTFDADPDDFISPLLERMQNQNEEIQKLKENNQSLMDKKHETAALKSTVTTLKEENSTLKNQNTTQNNRLTGLEKEISELKWRMNQIREENSRLQDEKKENEMMISDLKNEIQSLKAKAIDVSRFMQWESEEVLNWILSIEDGLYKKYEQKLREEIINSEVCGTDLITMDTGDLQQFGVTKFAHRKTLIGHIKKLTKKKKQNIPMNENEEEYEGVAAPTAYI
eukprot:207403_1